MDRLSVVRATPQCSPPSLLGPERPIDGYATQSRHVLSKTQNCSGGSHGARVRADCDVVSSPEQDTQLLRRDRVEKKVRAYRDVVTNRNAQVTSWMGRVGGRVVLSKTLNCSGGIAWGQRCVPTALS